MPIQIQDYEWSQTVTTVTIEVPLKGVPGHKADIFSTNEYIKASYQPYIFEVFLPVEVDDCKSKATISSGKITFLLEKKEPGLTWTDVQHEKHKDKDFTRRKREEAVLYSQERAEKLKERKAAERDQQQKFAVKQQMQVENEERSKIQAAKDAEVSKAMNELEGWKEAESKEPMHINSVDVLNDENSKNLDQHKLKNTKSKKEANISDEKKDLPPPRSTGSIQLKFTPRAFVTPTRESKAPEEEAWLQKVAEMKKIKADAATRADMEDMNPAWLKEKGSNFYKQGNHIAAINAFTAAIVLNDVYIKHLPTVEESSEFVVVAYNLMGAINTGKQLSLSSTRLYNNRGACHLHMKQYNECIQDSTMALNLLDPPVPANAKSRCIALIRRGTAYFETEQYVNALGDYNSALKIDPKNENIKEDAEKIRRIIQSS